MPDICMCPGGDCPRKKDCFRYRATPDIPQSYFMDPPYSQEECEYFEDINPYDRIRAWNDCLDKEDDG